MWTRAQARAGLSAGPSAPRTQGKFAAFDVNKLSSFINVLMEKRVSRSSGAILFVHRGRRCSWQLLT